MYRVKINLPLIRQVVTLEDKLYHYFLFWYTMDMSTKTEHKIEEIDTDNRKSIGRILFLRQVFVSSSIIFNFLIFGLYFGAPTVMIPQMRKEANSNDIITPEMASWLSSISSFSSLPWTIALPLIAHRFGRKPTLILLAINTFIGNVIFYRSTTFAELLISQAIQGMVMSSIYTITVMTLTEYVSPKYRGLIVTVKSATLFWGIWISNTLGTFFHWRTIGIAIFIFCIYNFSVILCPESPYWLAMKGRFEECAKSHRWLKGTDPDSENELRILILTQMSYLNNESNRNKQRDKHFIVTLYKIIKEKRFYRPLFYMTLTIALYNFSGKLACSVYVIEIIKKMTSTEKSAYEGMLIIDGVTVFCAYIGCFLTYALKRRSQLFLFSTTGVGFLFTLSIYLYMIKLGIVSENKYISLMLLVGFSISFSCGPMTIATCCYAELAPLKHRTLFVIVFGILASFLLGLILKISPFIFKNYECHGAFLFYGITASLCLAGLYKYLPETKNKTIQEIENIIAGEKTVIVDSNDFLTLKSVC